ncbi:hypothetical protein KIN20_033170 [Parelaphostrongylus tenuis]|uniref:Uncharacterized protein n=1 Tax=Parelaphostrongylus tenuis TaxID=148309 RepID=A0AAD5WIK5_PARTN|nr:hypothetical protein KIN20_033170 [Parelaphostrongylus tenuis]
MTFASGLLTANGKINDLIDKSVNPCDNETWLNKVTRKDSDQMINLIVRKTTLYVYLERSMNMEEQHEEELDRRRIAPRSRSLRKFTDRMVDLKARAHLCDSKIPAELYAAKIWDDLQPCQEDGTPLIERSSGLPKLNRHSQRLAGLRSSDLQKLSILETQKYIHR